MLKIVKILAVTLLIGGAYPAYAGTTTNKAVEIQQVAKTGDALGQAKMASLYLLGREGINKDNKLAAEWMLKAANQGLVEAQVVMAALYDRGLGVKHDVKMADSWYEKAANQGHGASLAILGRNDAAKGSIAFNYQQMRLGASRQIPNEYAKRFLRQK